VSSNSNLYGINKNIEQNEASKIGEDNNTKDFDGSELSDQDEEDTMKDSEASGSNDNNSLDGTFCL